jgi:hypothetical protein
MLAHRNAASLCEGGSSGPFSQPPPIGSRGYFRGGYRRSPPIFGPSFASDTAKNTRFHRRNFAIRDDTIATLVGRRSSTVTL